MLWTLSIAMFYLERFA